MTMRRSPESGLIELNAEQIRAATDWAADDRLWTTQEDVEINLRTFARVILTSALAQAAARERVLMQDATDAQAMAHELLREPEFRDRMRELIRAAFTHALEDLNQPSPEP
jgi:hypothetical protein